MLSPASLVRRLRLEIQGAVQGVGFRPHVYRLASELELAGWVVNGTRGVVLEVEGEERRLRAFALRLRNAPPRQAQIQELREDWLPPSGMSGFEIRSSDADGELTAAVLPDLATCPSCRDEVLEPGRRREGYPFTNCTECGPRLSIVRELPYDRPNTTMVGFDQCFRCRREYGDPGDRRFHAQPNACPTCGPHLGWWDGEGTALHGLGARGHPGSAGDRASLDAAVVALKRGRVVAVKGLGGFHLMVDATDPEAVRRLRDRKAREAKPLAVMVADLEMAREVARISPEAAVHLTSREAPIVLVPARGDSPLAPEVAPGNPRVGVMLAYTPLHHLLLQGVRRPLVATSGNRSDEPICIDNDEAVERLGGIADHFLVHDRPIERPVDDSVLAVDREHTQMVRRSRGYAPLPVRLPLEAPPLLAVGGHLKNTVAVSRGTSVFVSQHVGDLATLEAEAAFGRTVRDYLRLYRVEPSAVVHDLHPDYVSTRFAWTLGPRVPAVGVQHHHAHLASVLAEHGVPPDGEDVLGIIWDGTGYGLDGTIWGGEFLLGGLASSRRVGHLRTFPLPGGEPAVREPRRSALGLLLEAGLLERLGTDATREAFTPASLRLLRDATDRRLNAPVTSSGGRLFDGAASLLGLCQQSRFEGEGATALEFAADSDEEGAYLLHLTRGEGGAWVLDWEPLLEALLLDRLRGAPTGIIAARVHNGLADAMVRLAGVLGVESVALSGGCFLNRRLRTRVVRGLKRQGHRVLLNRIFPPGDGGIALGQIATAAARIASAESASVPVFPLIPQGV